MSEITLERIVEMRRDANKYGENYPVYSVSTMLALLDLAERGLAAQWRPIAELPANGKWYLLHDRRSGAYDIGRPIGPDSQDIESAFRGCIEGDLLTDYMPLPVSPAEEPGA